MYENTDIQNNFAWLDELINVDCIDFNEHGGLKVQPIGDQPIDFCNLQITNNLYDLIVKETNNYAHELFVNRLTD